MNDSQAAAQVRALIAENTQHEQYLHEELDELLCKLLRSLGYDQTVDAYESTVKWFA